MPAKYKIEIEATDKTAKGVKSAKRNLESMDGASGATSSAPNRKMRQQLQQFGKMYAEQTTKPMIKKGMIEPFKKKIADPFQKDIIKPFKKQIIEPFKTNVAASIKKGIIDPMRKQVADPLGKMTKGFGSKVMSPLGKLTSGSGFIGQAMSRRRERAALRASKKPSQSGKGGLGAGFGSKMSGIAMGAGAMIGIPLSMVAKLGKRFDSLIQEQVSGIRLGAGRQTGNTALGIRGAEQSQAMVGLMGTGQSGLGMATRLIASLDLAAEEAGRITGVFKSQGGGSITDASGMIAKGGANRTQNRALLREMAGILEQGISKGFRTSSEGLVRGLSMFMGLKIGGKNISTNEAGSITQNLNQGFQQSASLQGGAQQGMMFEAVRRQMVNREKMASEGQGREAKPISIIDVMKRLEQGATSGNIGALQGMMKDRFGGNKTAHTLAIKQLMGTSTSTAEGIANQGLTVGKEGIMPGALGLKGKNRDLASRVNQVDREGIVLKRGGIGQSASGVRNTVEHAMIGVTKKMSDGIISTLKTIEKTLREGIKLDLGITEVEIFAPRPEMAKAFGKTTRQE